MPDRPEVIMPVAKMTAEIVNVVDSSDIFFMVMEVVRPLPFRF
jgi:hypothetical protein